MRVLIVEDNSMNAELARDLLELSGHQVRVCTDGASLRREARAGEAADIVLMDILLPDADGLSLMRELRAIERFADTPIIALTAQALPGDATRFLEAGFDAVMTKPIDTRSFVGEVERKADGSNSDR